MTVPRLMVILVFAAGLVDAKLNNGRMVNMFWDQAMQFGYPQANAEPCMAQNVRRLRHCGLTDIGAGDE